MICGGSVDCPAGYFCGKAMGNPNHGVTNYDNIFYALLTTFQCVTLEGWSDIMVTMGHASTSFVFLFYVPLVLIGAFFLLNLTLAVINSSFTDTHRKHSENEKEELIKAKGSPVVGDQFALEEELKNMNEVTVSQYVIAKQCAKNMVAFLRKRQEARRQEAERMELQKKKEDAKRDARRKIGMKKMQYLKSYVETKTKVSS